MTRIGCVRFLLPIKPVCVQCKAATTHSVDMVLVSERGVVMAANMCDLPIPDGWTLDECGYPICQDCSGASQEKP